MKLKKLEKFTRNPQPRVRGNLGDSERVPKAKLWRHHREREREK